MDKFLVQIREYPGRKGSKSIAIVVNDSSKERVMIRVDELYRGLDDLQGS